MPATVMILHDQGRANAGDGGSTSGSLHEACQHSPVAAFEELSCWWRLSGATPQDGRDRSSWNAS